MGHGRACRPNRPTFMRPSRLSTPGVSGGKDDQGVARAGAEAGYTRGFQVGRELLQVRLVIAGRER